MKHCVLTLTSEIINIQMTTMIIFLSISLRPSEWTVVFVMPAGSLRQAFSC